MNQNDRWAKFGRPKKEEAEKKTKKILLSMTQKEYDKILRYQKFFGKKTVTATVEYLIEQGEDKLLREFESLRER